MSASLVDGAAGEPVIVYGTPPPEGRDLDVLVRGRARRRLVLALGQAGYRRHGRSWVKVDAGVVEEVDLTPVTRWGLSPRGRRALFASSLPLDGWTQLRRPSAAHVLLIEARRLVRAGGTLPSRSADRVRQALKQDPSAWDTATALAPGWRAGPALVCLREAVSGGRVTEEGYRSAARRLRRGPALRHHAGRLRRLLPKRSRAPFIALSGLDGSGKSGQADRLAQELRACGHEAVVVWTRLGSGERLRLAHPVKRVLRHVAPGSGTSSRPRYAAHADPGDPVRAYRERHRWLTFGWSLLVVIDNVLEQRRAVLRHLDEGRAVICDRWTLDSLTHLHYRYGGSAPLTVHRWLLTRGAPRPDLSVLLEVPAEVAFARKAEQYALEHLARQSALYAELSGTVSAVRLDGTRPPDEIAALLARTTLERLGGRSGSTTVSVRTTHRQPGPRHE